jgi:hypothetical protein
MGVCDRCGKLEVLEGLKRQEIDENLGKGWCRRVWFSWKVVSGACGRMRRHKTGYEGGGGI